MNVAFDEQNQSKNDKMETRQNEEDGSLTCKTKSVLFSVPLKLDPLRRQSRRDAAFLFVSVPRTTGGVGHVMVRCPTGAVLPGESTKSRV